MLVVVVLMLAYLEKRSLPLSLSFLLDILYGWLILHGE